MNKRIFTSGQYLHFDFWFKTDETGVFMLHHKVGSMTTNKAYFANIFDMQYGTGNCTASNTNTTGRISASRSRGANKLNLRRRRSGKEGRRHTQKQTELYQTWYGDQHRLLMCWAKGLLVSHAQGMAAHGHHWEREKKKNQSEDRKTGESIRFLDENHVDIAI